MERGFIVAGISTEIGKTVASAILVEALHADYWKPVQSGCLEDSDRETVQGLVSNQTSSFHREAYLLEQPLSPHAAAEIDGVSIEVERLGLPKTDNPLIVELAGGLMVPLTHTLLNLEMVKMWKLPVILVASYYLGSINHTLLTCEVLRKHGVEVHAIMFNGDPVQSSKEAIVAYSGINRIIEIPRLESLNKEEIKKHAERIAKEI
ncbi:MAG: dethiobiotin synthase [Bacteroidia bacterium]|nr:dethiobiotin synthase [Bacteroidia bacterium]